jgi:hypothetical protein
MVKLLSTAERMAVFAIASERIQRIKLKPGMGGKTPAIASRHIANPKAD